MEKVSLVQGHRVRGAEIGPCCGDLPRGRTGPPGRTWLAWVAGAGLTVVTGPGSLG